MQQQNDSQAYDTTNLCGTAPCSNTRVITGHVYPFNTVKPTALDLAYKNARELSYNSETKKYEEYKTKAKAT